MKKSLTLVLFALPLFLSAQAPKRSYIGFSFFIPTPTGTYKAVNNNDEKSLYAKGGFGYGLEGAFMFYPYIGVGGIWAGYSNKFNESIWDTQYSQYMESQGFAGTKKFEYAPHKISIFMVGPHASIPVKRFSFDFKFNVGYMSYQVAKVTCTWKSNFGWTGSDVIEGEKKSAFGINPGVGIRLKVSKMVALRLSADYVYGSFNVPFKVTQQANGQVYYTKTTPTSVSVSNFNVGLGLAFQLNKEE